MKNLTEILKHIQTRSKNLVVYSSMLLALTGTYACGGNDNSNNNAADAQVLEDGGSNNDGGISSSLLYNCDELCKLRQDCGCRDDADENEGGKCIVACEKGIDALSSEYVTEINKCFSKYPGTKVCGSTSGEECLKNAYSACVPGCTLDDIGTDTSCTKKLGDIIKPINEFYCKKAVECGLEGVRDGGLTKITEAECIEQTWLSMSECLSPAGLEESKVCIGEMSCSNLDNIYECELAGNFYAGGKYGLLKLINCGK